MSSRGIRLAFVSMMVIGICLLGVVLSGKYSLMLNKTNSLPGSVFLIERGVLPGRGELVFFQPPPSSFIHMRMLKEIGGVAGDVVEMRDRVFSVNGQLIGRAKETSVTGRPLLPGPVGTIEPGYLFVFGSSQDSYDSRYAEIGWVSLSQVIGRGHRLF